MNEVFLIGTIITNIEFKFIINTKDTSVAMFKIETLDNQIINIKAYNEMADFVYSHLEQNNVIEIYGYLKTDNSVIIKNVERI